MRFNCKYLPVCPYSKCYSGPDAFFAGAFFFLAAAAAPEEEDEVFLRDSTLTSLAFQRYHM